MDKYFELINLDKNYFYKNGCIDEELYNSIQLKINTYDGTLGYIEIKDVILTEGKNTKDLSEKKERELMLEKYFNDPEYMSKERLISLTKRANIIDKNEDDFEDKKTLLVV